MCSALPVLSINLNKLHKLYTYDLSNNCCSNWDSAHALKHQRAGDLRYSDISIIIISIKGSGLS